MTATIRQFTPPPAITARQRHDAMIGRLQAIQVPPDPAHYESHSSIAAWLEDTAAYLDKVVALIEPVFECAARQATEAAWPMVPESFDIVRGGAADYIAAFRLAQETLEDGR